MRYDDAVHRVPAAAVTPSMPAALPDCCRRAMTPWASRWAASCTMTRRRPTSSPNGPGRSIPTATSWWVVTSTAGTLERALTMMGRALSTALRSCGPWWPSDISPGTRFGSCSSSMRRMATMAVRPMPARPGRRENGTWRHSRAMPEEPCGAGPSMRWMRGPRRSEPGESLVDYGMGDLRQEELEWTSVRC